jgi:hypothetical protein
MLLISLKQSVAIVFPSFEELGGSKRPPEA